MNAEFVPELFSGNFKGHSRLDICLLLGLSNRPSPGGVRYDDLRDRKRALALSKARPPLARRQKAFLPWNDTYFINDAGLALLADFGHNPHFEWVGVPGVEGTGLPQNT